MGFEYLFFGVWEQWRRRASFVSIFGLRATISDNCILLAAHFTALDWAQARVRKWKEAAAMH